MAPPPLWRLPPPAPWSWFFIFGLSSGIVSALSLPCLGLLRDCPRRAGAAVLIPYLRSKAPCSCFGLGLVVLTGMATIFWDIFIALTTLHCIFHEFFDFGCFDERYLSFHFSRFSLLQIRNWPQWFDEFSCSFSSFPTVFWQRTIWRFFFEIFTFWLKLKICKR